MDWGTNLSTNNALFFLHCLMSYSMLLSMQVFVIDQFIFSFIINTAWPSSISSQCQTFFKNYSRTQHKNQNRKYWTKIQEYVCYDTLPISDRTLNISVCWKGDTHWTLEHILDQNNTTMTVFSQLNVIFLPRPSIVNNR